MSSIIKVDTVQDIDGNNIINENADVITIGASGDTITSAGTFTSFTSTGIDDNATSTAITIDSSENVGIGIVNPSQKLHVEGAGSTYAKIKSTNAGSGTGLYFQNATGNYIIGAGAVTGGSELAFYDATNSAERMRIHTNGAVLIGATLSGSATAGDLVVNSGVFLGGTAAANKLDDYEEGTWTPSDVSGSGLSLTVTGDAKYVKIGNQVFFNVNQINYPSTAAGADARIGGLPFTNSAVSTGTQNFVGSNAYANKGLVIANATFIFLYQTSSASAATNAQLSNAEIYGISGVYTI